jgi:hypothetical protein
MWIVGFRYAQPQLTKYIPSTKFIEEPKLVKYQNSMQNIYNPLKIRSLFKPISGMKLKLD